MNYTTMPDEEFRALVRLYLSNAARECQSAVGLALHASAFLHGEMALETVDFRDDRMDDYDPLEEALEAMPEWDAIYNEIVRRNLVDRFWRAYHHVRRHHLL